MYFFFRIWVVFFLLLTAACSTKPISLPLPGADLKSPGQSVFQDAELAYDKGLYNEALVGYQHFLHQSYGDRHTDTALFKIGRIYRRMGNDEDSLAVFARLTHEFPQSVLVPDAMHETLTLLFERGQFDAVISMGLGFTQKAGTSSLSPPFYMVIADAYTALGARLNAARFYYRAWNVASGNDEQIAWNQLKKSVEKLDTDEIQQLIALVADRPVMGLLLYRLGMAYLMDESYDDARDVLGAFVDQFPEHAERQDALDMLQSLALRSQYSPYAVGCLLPLSGAYSFFGQRALDGIEFAVNQMGTVGDGSGLSLIIKDTRSDPAVAENAVKALDQEKVGAILGPMATSERAAAAAQHRGIPIVVFTQRDGLPETGAYVFRNFITPQMQVRALVNVAVEKLGVRCFAILYPDEKYGRRYMNLFWDEVLRQGGIVNGVEAYDPAGTDFAQPIKKLAGIFYGSPKNLSDHHLSRCPLRTFVNRQHQDEKNKGERRNGNKDDHYDPLVDFSAIFIPDAPKKASMVIPQLAYHDIRDVYLLGTNLWHSQALVDASGDYMENALIVDGFFAESQSQNVKDFVAAFQSAFERTPGIIEAIAYDSAMMMFQAMHRAATPSRRDLKDALLRLQDFEGVSGRAGFAPNGEAEKNLELLRIERGRFVQLPLSPAAENTPSTAVLTP
ncbi:penicillin-binding protein activator [Desulfosarcina ovata]|nr:penicillin-binding protein activator [Desulfosarcina ovata]